jgi:putative membrane protein
MFFDGPHGGWGRAFGLASILFWVFAAVAIAAFVRLFTRGLGFAGGPGLYGPPRPATPEQIMAERFARGEINPDEFYERVALPTEAPRPGPTTMAG